MSTHKFGNIEEKKFDPKDKGDLQEYLVKHKILGKNDKILFSTLNENIYNTNFTNSFLGTIKLAYDQHVPLKLNPDKIWFSILSSLGIYINANSEEMRKLFVNHDGKKELVIDMIGSFQTMTEDTYKEFIELVTNLLDESINDKLKDWIIPSFSTTKDIDVFNSKIAFMNTMKSYFTYICNFKCGLSSITLDGTLKDYQDLVDKVKKLCEFKKDVLSEWTSTLLYVLEEFVNFKKGNINENFWQTICTYKSGGSGPAKHGGWFTVFSPFDKKGNYLLNSLKEIKKDNIFTMISESSFVGSEVCVPMLVKNDDGTVYDVTLYAGIAFTKYENKCLEPVSDMAIIHNIK